MDTEEIKSYCLAKPCAEETYPFGEWPICYKVKGKIFAQVYRDKVTVKCTAFSGEAFRAAYPGIVVRGYHCPPVQQPYWNTIDLARFPSEELPMMIDHAYETVVSALPKKVRREITEDKTMNIRLATPEDLPFLTAHDRHVSPAELNNLIALGRVSIAEVDGSFVGWLRWNLFWDNTPFLNMLYLLEPHRGKGYGTAMMAHWEQRMAASGYETVMTSTASDEYAQHFYRKLGYTAIGGFTPFGESYELLFSKQLNRR